MQTTAVAAGTSPAEGFFARQNYGTASVQRAAWPARRRRAGIVEVLLVRGLITAVAWAGMHGGAAHFERRSRSIASVSLMAGVTVAVDDVQMWRADVALVRAGLLLNPRAFVVSARDLPVFKAYAWRMAREGIDREAFSASEMPDALRWAQEKGLLMQADRRHQAAASRARAAVQ